ncbi:metal-dependent hydrolase [Halobacteriovorax sp. HLS]|uniref:metal-dependent hydrolase n=1 Tax=Halobacteriovorax sp. HLS TaxID=2234000 RepID=UPI000FDC2725|nr:metal-dependent hydrolase [Halobacteriovorax sp. HLS]
MKILISLMLFVSTAMATEVTWLGQAAFLIKTNEGKRILIDPFIFSNPKTPASFKDEKLYKNIDLILLTHGHGDHVGDFKKIMELSPNSKISMNADMGNVMLANGLITKDRYFPLNKSGEILPFEDKTKVIMVRAEHSSSLKIEGKVHYGGEPVGYVIQFSNGKSLYHAGDTGVFGDMKMIGSYYRPDLALLPIGGNYTMGPKEAAFAIDNFIKPKVVVPMHYGTFPILKGTPSQLKGYLKNKKVLNVIDPGQKVTL